MQIAQVMAGYSLGEADLLRRAMGKKDKAEHGQAAGRASSPARSRTASSKADADYIFELVDKFAGYGFNKSHAAAYALVSYHTAYLKANYREEFLAASMTLDMGNTDKLAMFTSEAKKSGIAVLPPCVNASEVDFLAEPSRSSGRAGRHPLLAGRLEEHRRAGRRDHRRRAQRATGRFKDLVRLRRPLQHQGAQQARAGDAGRRRRLRRARAQPRARARQRRAACWHSPAASRRTRPRAPATSSAAAAQRRGRSSTCAPLKAWTPMEQLQREFEAVGFFLSGHPLDAYAARAAEARRQAATPSSRPATERGATAGRLAGIVVSARERRSQKGNKFAFAMFSEPTGQFEAVIFSETLAACARSAGAGHRRCCSPSRASATATP